MKKLLHDLLYKHYPRLWFLARYSVENEYQDYVVSRDDIVPYGATLKKFLALSPVWDSIVRGRTFLEIGCDTGFFPLMAAQRGATEVVGVDRNLNALGKAEKARKKMGFDHVAFKHAVVPDIGIMNQFNVVLLMSVMHYMFSDKCGNQILFSNMDSFVEYVSQYVGDCLLVEFVGADDPAAQKIVAKKFLSDGTYGEESFLVSLKKKYKAVSSLGGTHYETRRLFLAKDKI